jgi:hypothetical protein
MVNAVGEQVQILHLHFKERREFVWTAPPSSNSPALRRGGRGGTWDAAYLAFVDCRVWHSILL